MPERFYRGSTEPDARRPDPLGLHLADMLRVGLMAGHEEAVQRFHGHVLQCGSCREAALRLAGRLDAPVGAQPVIACAEAINETVRFLEQTRPVSDAAVAHIRTCESCRDHILEPVRNVQALDEGSSISAQD